MTAEQLRTILSHVEEIDAVIDQAPHEYPIGHVATERKPDNT